MTAPITAARPAEALVIEKLSHGFGPRQALSDVNLSISPGSFLVLLGPNGAGKTTLVALVTGLYNARQGDIRIFGHSIRRDPLPALASLGVVFQMPTLDLDLTVSDNLRYHGALQGLSRREAAERAAVELERLGLAERSRETVRTLSGGLRRRVEIARALLHGPRLLIVDEATSGLDVAGRRGLLEHVRSLCREGVSVLWATHRLDEIEPGDQLAVLHRGRILWTGIAGDFAGLESMEAAFLRVTGDAE